MKRTRVKTLHGSDRMDLPTLIAAIEGDAGTWYRVKKCETQEEGQAWRRRLLEQFPHLEATVTLGGVLQVRAPLPAASSAPRWASEPVPAGVSIERGELRG